MGIQEAVFEHVARFGNPNPASFSFGVAQLAGKIGASLDEVRALAGTSVGQHRASLYQAGGLERIRFDSSAPAPVLSDARKLVTQRAALTPAPTAAEEEIVRLQKSMTAESAKEIARVGRLAIRYMDMLADAPEPVSSSVEGEFENGGDVPPHVIAQRAREYQAAQKRLGNHISTSKAVEAVSPKRGTR